MAQESIVVYIRPTQTFQGVGNHMYILYNNSLGQQYYLGGKSYDSGSILSGWGTIDVQVTSWGPGAFDYQWHGTAVASEVIRVGTDLSSYWNLMKDAAEKIDYANLQYGILGVNSNAVVNTVLLAAGLPPVSKDTDLPWGDYWTPGGSIDLRIFDLNKKYLPDEPASLSGGLAFYQPFFGWGHGGLLYNSSPLDPFGGPAISMGGRWVYSGVGEPGGAMSWGWTWVDDKTASRLTPVVLDLDGDGIELTAAEASPGFDVLGTGHSHATGWFTGGDGLLVFDSNQNGRVDNISEISFLHHSPGATTDLQALAALDSNFNGRLDSGDAAFPYFRIWRDADFDGITDAGEMQTLSSLNISSISLQGSGGGYQVNGNQIWGVTTFTRANGSTGNAYDVGFKAFSQGSKFMSQDSIWAVLELETGELMSVVRPGAGGMTITDLASYTTNGVRPTGFQFSDNNDVIYTASWGSDRSLYVDARGGSNTMFLSSSNFGGVIKGGDSYDVIRGTAGSDYIAPGRGSNVIVDIYGSEYYMLSVGSHTQITDCMGSDVVMAIDYSYNQVQFGVDPNNPSAVLISALDNSFSMTFDRMRSSASYEIEYVVLKDRTITGDQIMDMVGGYSGGGTGGGGGGGGPGGGGGLENPVVFDLDGDGFELIAANKSPVFFDWDGDGAREQTGWVGPDDALLVFDRDGDGNITRADEIAFGFIGKRNEPSISDLEGLRLFDTNGNGRLDSRDAEFGRFGVWNDRDSDAIVDAGELISLTGFGLESLSLDGQRTGDDAKSNQNVIYAVSEAQFADGTVMDIADAIFAHGSDHQWDPSGSAPMPADDPQSHLMIEGMSHVGSHSWSGEWVILF